MLRDPLRNYSSVIQISIPRFSVNERPCIEFGCPIHVSRVLRYVHNICLYECTNGNKPRTTGPESRRIEFIRAALGRLPGECMIMSVHAKDVHT